MKLFIGYATSEGQTRKIARHFADRAMEAGHSVELLALSDAESMDLSRFDGVVLAASIHAGHYQRSMTDFAEDHLGQLRNKPTLLLSVSLAAAGHDSEEWKGLSRILEDFAGALEWMPDRIEQVAGAYRPSQYDIFRRFIMRRIIALKTPDANLDEDVEYTDWAALDALCDDWLGGLVA